MHLDLRSRVYTRERPRDVVTKQPGKRDLGFDWETNGAAMLHERTIDGLLEPHSLSRALALSPSRTLSSRAHHTHSAPDSPPRSRAQRREHMLSRRFLPVHPAPSGCASRARPVPSSPWLLPRVPPPPSRRPPSAPRRPCLSHCCGTPPPRPPRHGRGAPRHGHAHHVTCRHAAPRGSPRAGSSLRVCAPAARAQAASFLAAARTSGERVMVCALSVNDSIVSKLR